MDKVKVFEYELGFIKGDWIRRFAQRCINELPNYFFEVPASSTSKYHPSYALGEGGLVRHTKAAVRIALELFVNESIQQFTSDQKDMIIVALILHDGAKHGLDGSKYTVATHPKDVVDMLKDNPNVKGIVDEDVSNTIFDCIATHMGQWNVDWKTKKEILDKPSNGLQRFVHMCDYLASRKCLEFNFDVDVSRS